MENQDFTVVNRGAQFASVIENTISTDINGQLFSLEQTLNQVMEQFKNTKSNGGAVYLVGNGGSAAVASHAITDFTNVCRLRAFTLHESSLITCMTNDFGYENAYARLCKTVMRPGDILIAISSSGKSPNICNAAKMATDLGGIVITMSGFNADNPLRKLGDLNFWLDSCDYGLVEIGHLFLLHNISDRIGLEIKNQGMKIAESNQEFFNTN